MSFGITRNNRQSPLETNRSFIFPPSNNIIWTNEPKHLLQLQEEVYKKNVLGNITNNKSNTNSNTNINNHQNKNINKIVTFPNVEVKMPIHFIMTPHFVELFIGNNNFWMNKIQSILKNLGLNFLYYEAEIHSLRYTYIPNINIKTKKENLEFMSLCYSNLKALIDEHIYSIIEHKIKTNMMTLDHEFEYAQQYLQTKITTISTNSNNM